MFAFSNMMCVLCVMCMIPNSMSQLTENETIIWSDAMDWTNGNENWRTYGTAKTIRCPINSTEMCLGIVRTNVAPNPYIYRVTNVSDLPIITSNNQTLTLLIQFDIIPWNLQPTMQCQALFSTIKKSEKSENNNVHSNIEWQIIAKYDSTENGIKLLSESYEIPITQPYEMVEIGIKFMLYNNDNTKANLIGPEEHNACYLSSISLFTETVNINNIHTKNTPQLKTKHNSNKLVISGNPSLDLLFFISFGVLFVILCTIITIVVFGCYCVYLVQKKNKNSIRKKIKDINDISNTNTVTKYTNTSLQLGRIDPYIEQFAITPTSRAQFKATYSTKNDGNNFGLEAVMSETGSPEKQFIDYIETIETIETIQIDKNTPITPLRQVIHKSVSIHPSVNQSIIDDFAIESDENYSQHIVTNANNSKQNEIRKTKKRKKKRKKVRKKNKSAKIKKVCHDVADADIKIAIGSLNQNNLDSVANVYDISDLGVGNPYLKKQRRPSSLEVHMDDNQ